MTTLGRREKCLRNRWGKGFLLAWRAHQMRNRSLPGAAGSTVDQNRAKTCRPRLFGLYRELESERKNGNPGLDHKCHFAELCPAIQGLRALIRK